MELLKEERDSLIEQAVELWRVHAETYRTNIFRYKFLIAWKRELMKSYKKLALKKIPRYILDDYPDLPLFRIVDEDSVRIALEEMATPELSYLVYYIRYELECNHAYRTVNTRVMEMLYEISHIDDKPSAFGIDTEARYSCSYRTPKRPHHIRNSN